MLEAVAVLRAAHLDAGVLGFADGPLEVLLQTTGLPSPFPSALEEHLYLLLLNRARAHMR